MKRSERDAWTDALRSGKYQQGTGRLKHGDSYCCLGVKCDLDQVDWQPCTGLAGVSAFKEAGENTEWYGFVSINRTNAWGLPHESAQDVAYMNDAGKSFAEIADWIEANVPVEEG